MQRHRITPVSDSTRLDRLAADRLTALSRRLEQAEAAYQKHPTHRNLDRQVIAYHAWYWATRTEATR